MQNYKENILFRKTFFFFLFLGIYFGFLSLNLIYATPSTSTLLISDAIAPFFDPDEPIKHYSGIPYDQIDLPDGAVDQDQLDQALTRSEIYFSLLRKKGYTHITFDDLNHLLLLPDVSTYRGSDIEKRNKLYQNFFHRYIQLAHQYDLKILVTTDMQWYTDSLLMALSGTLSPHDPDLRKINQSAFRELFTTFPEIDGVVLRIGEGGGAYNTTYYKSRILYDSPSEVRQMLQDILPIFDQYQKKLVFRTWSIGIGTIGDIILSPETYDMTFSGLSSSGLIISIKHTPGDFFAFTTENPTIGHGVLQQIIEFQSRREYEGGGEIPNSSLGLYAEIRDRYKNTPTVIGYSHWHQTGGWGYGQTILVNFGFDFWNFLNFVNLDPVHPQVPDTLQFGKYNTLLSNDEKQVITKIFTTSRSVIEQGWYIDRFRQETYVVKGIIIPPLLWIWWDRPTGSPLLLSLIFSHSEWGSTSIDASRSALAQARSDREDFERIMNQSGALSTQIFDSLWHREKTIEILGLYQDSLFSYFSGNGKIHQALLIEKIEQHNAWLLKRPFLGFDWSEVKKFILIDESMGGILFSLGAKFFLMTQTLWGRVFLFGGILLASMALISWIRYAIAYKRKQQALIHFLLFIILLCFLGSIFYTYFFIILDYPLMPTYFHEAGSHVSSFFSF